MLYFLIFPFTRGKYENIFKKTNKKIVKPIGLIGKNCINYENVRLIVIINFEKLY